MSPFQTSRTLMSPLFPFEIMSSSPAQIHGPPAGPPSRLLRQPVCSCFADNELVDKSFVLATPYSDGYHSLCWIGFLRVRRHGRLKINQDILLFCFHIAVGVMTFQDYQMQMKTNTRINGSRVMVKKGTNETSMAFGYFLLMYSTSKSNASLQ
jgi:hypothetical protein